MFSALLMFIPEDAYPLVLVLAGLLLILGMRKRAMGLVGFILLIALLGPFIDVLIANLPPCLFAVLCLLMILSLIRMIFGRGVADHLISMILFGILLAPFRFLGWLLQGFRPGRRT